MSTTQPINIPINHNKNKNCYSFYNNNTNNYIYNVDNIPDYPSTPDDKDNWNNKLKIRINNYSKCNNFIKM